MTSGRVAAVVVGGGPAGLALAVELRRGLVAAGRGSGPEGRVVVLDRDPEAGGVPRHSDHPGFGLRDLGRAMTGPAYAAHYRRLAGDAGVEVRAASTVTDVAAGRRAVAVTSPCGVAEVEADAVVLATGCRERPRSARLVAGDRPAGVYTTGWLQQAVHLYHQPVGSTAVVVGAEHVSYSAVLTLAEAGCRTVAMVTEQPTTSSFAAFDLAARTRYRFPLLTGTRVVGVAGRGRVEAVELVPVGSDPAVEPRRVPCDTVVFTGDWVAEVEAARRAGLRLDVDGTGGPVVDTGLRTAAPGVFAAGNVLHPAETADVCALDGRHAAGSVLAWLLGSPWPGVDGSVPVQVAPPLVWVAPQRVVPGELPPRGRLVLRAAEPLGGPGRGVRLGVTQGSRVLWQGSVGRLDGVRPERSFSIPARWTAAVDPAAPVAVTVR